MLDTEREGLGKEIMQMVLQGAEPSVVRASAANAKARLFQEYVEVWRVANLIDTIVGTYANDPTWQIGLVPQQQAQAVDAATQPKATSERGRRVLAIASDMVNRGGKTVSARDIAHRLSMEGEELPEKDLATASGNILARAAGWKRVKPGVYAPLAVQQEMGTVA